MKKCNSCGKTIEDDMIYCPYCGDKYHDYHDDLKDALNDLDKPKLTTKPIKTKEQKENDFLNKILIFLVCAIVVVGLVGVVMIGKNFVDFGPKDPVVNEDNNNQNDSQDENTNDDVIIDDNQDDENTNDDVIVDDNQDDQQDDQQDENVSGVIDVTNEENGDFKILEFKISKEDGQVRFDIESETTIAGNIFLMDNANLSIGPISIDEGTSSYYFLINGKNNYTLYFDASNGREYEYHISKEQIKEALKE